MPLIVSLFSLLLTTSVYAEPALRVRKPAHSGTIPQNRMIVSTVLYSWKEFVDLQSASATDKTKADYFGYGIGFGLVRYSSLRTGYNFYAHFLTGQSSLGTGEQGNVTLAQSGPVRWWGIAGGLHYFYRMNGSAAIEVGPLFLFRNANFSNDQSSSRSSASLFSGAGVVALRILLSPQVELYQSMGVMASKPTTIWSFGLGWRFI